MSGVNDGTKYNDFVFKLYERKISGEIIEVEYQGVWFMVDNGYLNWLCTVPPVKNATSYQTIRFSEWLESMRKDVECTFGILNKYNTYSISLLTKLFYNSLNVYNIFYVMILYKLFKQLIMYISYFIFNVHIQSLF